MKFCLFVVVFLVSCCHGSSSKKETRGDVMTDRIKCDMCRAIAYQLWEIFDQFEGSEPSDDEVVPSVRAVCSQTTFQKYTIKEVKHVRRLCGPGLETESATGKSVGDKWWPSRIMSMCEDFVKEFGESAMYTVFKAGPRSMKRIEYFLCKGEGNSNACRDFDTFFERRTRDEL